MTDGFDIDIFLVEFVSECREATDLAVHDVLNLEQGHDQDSVDRIFRALHSIKGNASMFGLMALSEFVHKVEDACSDIRSGERPIDKLAINVLLRSFDLIEDAFQNIIEKSSDEIDYSKGYKLIGELSQAAMPVTEAETPQQPTAEPVSEPEISETEPAPLPEINAPEEEQAPAQDIADLEKKFHSRVESTKFDIPAGESYQASSRISPVRKNPTALIVDDDFVTRKIFISFLSKYMPCYVAKDGVEAIQAVTESLAGNTPHFDLIIMDIMMPNIDGLQACKAIRQIERSKNIESFAAEAKIFIASTLDDDKTMLKAMYECGADSYLVKPVSFDDLRRHLVRFRIIDPE